MESFTELYPYCSIPILEPRHCNSIGVAVGLESISTQSLSVPVVLSYRRFSRAPGSPTRGTAELPVANIPNVVNRSYNLRDKGDQARVSSQYYVRSLQE